MFGHGRGLHRGTFWRHTPMSVPKGYAYIGPCKCGFGPDAFYQNKRGGIVHASQVFRWGIPPTLTGEGLEEDVNRLKKEKQNLRKE